ncbi:YIP1 family protein [Oceanobacillus sp. FSL K6-0118]|uniref:YIP1 family protein n=1 Tax=Oceanobacillus sp. FSL K6-0118 TaxID=2921418 RepID=UPI0040469B10
MHTKVAYIKAPIYNLENIKRNPPVFFLIICITILCVFNSLLTTNDSMSNSEILDLLSKINISSIRLQIVLTAIALITLITNSLIGYLVLACIFKIIFILMRYEVKFSKVIFSTYYMSLIGLMMMFLNVLISYFVNNGKIQLYTNLSFLASENSFSAALLQLLDPFILFQFVILYLFVKKVVKLKKWQAQLFTSGYIIIFITVQLLSVVIS